MNTKSMGQILHEAFPNRFGLKTPWGELPEQAHDDYEAVALAVIAEERETSSLLYEALSETEIALGIGDLNPSVRVKANAARLRYESRVK